VLFSRVNRPLGQTPSAGVASAAREPTGGWLGIQHGLESLSALGRSAGPTSSLLGAVMGSIVATRRAHDGDIVLTAETSVSAGKQRAGRDLGGDISPGRIGSCERRATKATGSPDTMEKSLEEEGKHRDGLGRSVGAQPRGGTRLQ
jgi:hypothetical protein